LRHHGTVEAISRRAFLRAIGGIAGVAALAPAASLLSACSPARSPGVAGTPGPVVVTLGSNASDPVPKAALASVLDAFTRTSGIRVSVNTTDHASFQDQISTYLQGRPDDVFTWFGGYRMRFFADRGLVGSLEDVWPEIAAHLGPGATAASLGSDGRPYFVPFVTYPWVVLYRRSVWEKKGYAPPTTFDGLLALCDRIRSDGLVPFAFGDKDGWPAMGWFDILDLRLNGYDFHVALLDGREKWTDDRVRTVFEMWRRVIPHLQPAALGRSWQDAAQALVAGDAAMFFGGTTAGEQVPASDKDDIDMFAFPSLGTAFDAEAAIDAPINGFMRAPHPREPDAATALLRYLGTGDAQNAYLSASPSYVAAAKDADTTGYSPFQLRIAAILSGSKRSAQFFDRDTRPDFAGPNGMQARFQDFLADPGQDLDAYLSSIQKAWDALD
jgi:multiple sugar transport system substrate-binding protein